MSKKEYIKPDSVALDLVPGESLLQTSLDNPDFGTQQIEDIELTFYDWL